MQCQGAVLPGEAQVHRREALVDGLEPNWNTITGLRSPVTGTRRASLLSSPALSAHGRSTQFTGHALITR
jgi:hypothetical protein